MRGRWGVIAVVVLTAVAMPEVAPLAGAQATARADMSVATARADMSVAGIRAGTTPANGDTMSADVTMVRVTPATVGAALAGPSAIVITDGGPLNVRAAPSTINRVTARLEPGTRVTVLCQVYGQSIVGPRRRSAYWFKLGRARYLSDAYLRWRPRRPLVRWCGANGEPALPVIASAGGPVNVRSGPTSRHRLLGRAPNGARLAVRCQRWGDRIPGPRGASKVWNLLVNNRYVADAMVAWTPSRPLLPFCGQAPSTVPAATPARFIARVARPARLGARRYRVPASVTIAQAILESGWGRSGLTRRDHNYFGIKCHGDPGPFALGCRPYATHECGGGRCWRTRASFRAYRNASGSMADHGRFLVVNARYRRAFRFYRKPNKFAVAIHRAGYATSPRYARNLIRVMRVYNLYRYDR